MGNNYANNVQDSDFKLIFPISFADRETHLFVRDGNLNTLDGNIAEKDSLKKAFFSVLETSKNGGLDA